MACDASPGAGFVDKTQKNSFVQNARQLHVSPSSRQTADSCGKTGVTAFKGKTVTKLKLFPVCVKYKSVSYRANTHFAVGIQTR